MAKLSPAQRRALTLIAQGRPAYSGMRTQSQHGGLSGTLSSLHRRQYLNSDGEVTEAGLKALGVPQRKDTVSGLNQAEASHD